MAKPKTMRPSVSYSTPRPTPIKDTPNKKVPPYRAGPGL